MKFMSPHIAAEASLLEAHRCRQAPHASRLPIRQTDYHRRPGLKDIVATASSSLQMPACRPSHLFSSFGASDLCGCNLGCEQVIKGFDDLLGRPTFDDVSVGETVTE